ncbi:MAG: fumarylacetoacetate hydrolase family protein [Myxococcales bacterium]|nr:fumarylacetoacetate hydrolase family protein [Myxococcales bacterium]
MKLVTFDQGQGSERGGIVAHDAKGPATFVIDLESGLLWLDREKGGTGQVAAVREKAGHGILGFIEHAAVVRPLADELLARFADGSLPVDLARPLSSTKLLAPVPRPPSMRDGYAFRQHVETARRNRGLEMIPEFDQFPVFYFTNHQSVIGPGELLVQKRQAERLDFELEAAVVLGKRGKNVPASRADELIFGLTIMNDFSARVLQMDEMKLSLGPAKGKDFATGLGPWLVTLDELLPRATKTERGLVFDLEMRATVNGVVVSRGNVRDMNWTFAQILERVTDSVWAGPGEVIGSGTCGTGCFLELNGSKITDNQWLKVGDRIVLEIDGLGALEHVVVAADESMQLGR